MLDRLLGLAEVEVQATEVVEQPADVSLVVDLLVVGLRALSVIARLDPVPHPLADKRSLEVRVRGLARIVERLRELDVLARCFEVSLAAITARAPAEDVRAQTVARKLGALGQRQSLVEEVERCRDAGELVAANGEAEEQIRAIDVGELRRLGKHPRPVEQLDRGLDFAVLHPSPSLARELANLELGHTRREDGRLAVLVLGDRLCVLMGFGQRVRAREQRVDAPALVCRDATLEEAGIDAELDREPLDGLARGPGLAALDLADVLLREAVAREIGLRQAGGDAKLPHALAQAIARVGAAAGGRGSARHERLTGSQLHTSPISNPGHSVLPLKGHVRAKNKSSAEPENHLIELLDDLRGQVYSQATLQHRRTPGRSCRGRAKEWRRIPGSGGWAAES